MRTGAFATAAVLMMQPAFAAVSHPPAERDGLPDCTPAGPAPICRLLDEVSASEAEALLAGRSLGWRAQGERFTVVARHPGPAVQLAGAINTMMGRIDQTDLWVLTVRIPQLQRALVDMFVTPGAGSMRPAEWRGPGAPAKPVPRRELRGRILTEIIDSRRLGEPRRLWIYTPPGHDSARRYPVVYLADGGDVLDYARIVEPLVDAGELPPHVMVGLEAGDNERRSAEYLVGWKGSNAGFEAHEAFLLEEVLPRAELRYGASAKRAERMLMGKSSGAAWALQTGVRHPGVFGRVAAFSMGWRPALEGVDRPGRPQLFLGAGLFEGPFHLRTTQAAAKARASGEDVVLIEAVSGHSPAMWELLALDALQWAFAGKRSGWRLAPA